MEQRRSSGNSVAVLVALVLVAAVTSGVDAQSVYSCLGGCYNECFLRSSKTQPERLSCYYLCLNSCVPRTPASYQYYCQIGCSLELCSGFVSDGASLEKCYGRCSNLCKFPRI